MNFDVNTLSTLMQLMNAQRPREQEAANPSSADTADNGNTANSGYAGYDVTAHSHNSNSAPQRSAFAMQNGLGQQFDFAPKQERKQTSNTSVNPMSSLLDIMTGKTSTGNSDALSGLIPMLMNMMGSKNAQVAQNSASNQQTNSKDNKTFEQKLREAKENADKNMSSSVSTEKPNDHKVGFTSHNTHKTRDRYDPITFAGYTLISSLNKLFISKKNEAIAISNRKNI